MSERMNKDSQHTRRSREELKAYFQKGDVPTEEQFAELIDSVPNFMDDEWIKTLEEGEIPPKPEPIPEPTPEPPSPKTEDGYFTIQADKQWYDVPMTESTDDCHSLLLSIYAAYHNYESGFMTAALAEWNVWGDVRIRSDKKHWWGWSGCICIRWNDDKQLQIRSRMRADGEIKCRIVELFRG